MTPLPEGPPKSFTYSPQEGDGFPLSDLPVSAIGRWEIALRFWDKRADGQGRSFPLLEGSKTVTQKDLNQPHGVSIPLHLKVPLRDLD